MLNLWASLLALIMTQTSLVVLYSKRLKTQSQVRATRCKFTHTRHLLYRQVGEGF